MHQLSAAEDLAERAASAGPKLGLGSFCIMIRIAIVLLLLMLTNIIAGCFRQLTETQPGRPFWACCRSCCFEVLVNSVRFPRDF